jgi:PIN domain nuclease of toxin-antitoxin system
MILLDTHAWIRWLHPELGQPLPPALRHWLEYSPEPLAVSVISCLEVAQLVKKGILLLPLPLPQWYEAALEESSVTSLPLTPKLLHASTMLPDIHRDPADRIIIATAHEYDAMLITADTTVSKYPGLRVMWNQASQ